MICVRPGLQESLLKTGVGVGFEMGQIFRPANQVLPFQSFLVKMVEKPGTVYLSLCTHVHLLSHTHISELQSELSMNDLS